MSVSNNFSMRQINQALDQISKIEVDKKSSTIKSRIYVSSKNQKIAVKNSNLFRVITRVMDYLSGYRGNWKKGLAPLADLSSKIKQLVDQKEWADPENSLSKIDVDKLIKVKEKIEHIQTLVKSKETDSDNKINPNEQWIAKISKNISTILTTIQEKKAGFEKAKQDEELRQEQELKLKEEEIYKSEIATLFLGAASNSVNGLSVDENTIREILNNFSSAGSETISINYPEEVKEPQDLQLQVPINFNKDVLRLRSVNINNEQMYTYSTAPSIEASKEKTQEEKEKEIKEIKIQEIINDQIKINITKKLQTEFGIVAFENLAYLLQQEVLILYVTRLGEQIIQPLKEKSNIQIHCLMSEDKSAFRVSKDEKDQHNPHIKLEIITPLSFFYVKDNVNNTVLDNEIIIRTEISAPLTEWQEKIEGKKLNEIMPHLTVIDHMSYIDNRNN